MSSSTTPPLAGEHFTTLEVAQRLGLAVRSVQLMVDRGELEAWKTPGGHRRISRASVNRWLASRSGAPQDATGQDEPPRSAGGLARPQRVLLIEDSKHFQNLVSLLARQQFPDVELHVADDGVAGLILCGRLQPEVMVVDILLPGIDGATLITSLRAQPELFRGQLIVVTSLDADQRAPYAFALPGVPVVHKPRLVMDLPPLLTQALSRSRLPAGAGNVA